MRKTATYKKQEQGKLTCPVCKAPVSIEHTRIIQICEWLDTKLFYKPGAYLMQEVLAGKFKEWACISCEKTKKAIFPDYSKQKYGYGGPILFYISKNVSCISCKKEFTFEAEEQKLWYEDLSFNYCSFPKNCLECRKKIRFKKQLHKTLGDLLSSEPNTPEQLEEIAQIYQKLDLVNKAELFTARANNKKRSS